MKSQKNMLKPLFKPLKPLFAGLMLMQLMACERITAFAYNTVEHGYAERVISGLFESQGVKSAPECQMMAVSRDFSCELTLSPQDTERLAKALKLQLTPIKEGRFNYHYQQYPQACEKRWAAQLTELQYYEVKASRTPEIKSLEYLTLYLHPSKQQACLQASHQFG